MMAHYDFNIEVSAYKTLKVEGLFLFIIKEKDITSLSNEILVMFGTPIHVVNFNLTPQRKLPIESSIDVYNSIIKNGYYLQIPPKDIEKYSDITPPPENLDNIF